MEGLGLVSVSGKIGKVSPRSCLDQTFKRLGLVSVSKEKVSFTSLIEGSEDRNMVARVNNLTACQRSPPMNLLRLIKIWWTMDYPDYGPDPWVLQASLR